MGKTSVLSENKHLVMVLALMCLIIAVLAGFIFVGMNRSGEEVAVDGDSDDGGELYTITTGGYSTVDAEKLEDARAQANELMARNDVSAEEIINFYTPYIDDYIAKSEPDRISAYIWDRNDNLISHGYKQEALDVLLAMNLDVLNEAEKNRQYANIVALARELGLEEIANKYYNILTAEVNWGDAAIERSRTNIVKLEGEGQEDEK